MLITSPVELQRYLVPEQILPPDHIVETGHVVAARIRAAVAAAAAAALAAIRFEARTTASSTITAGAARTATIAAAAFFEFFVVVISRRSLGAFFALCFIIFVEALVFVVLVESAGPVGSIAPRRLLVVCFLLLLVWHY